MLAVYLTIVNRFVITSSLVAIVSKYIPDGASLVNVTRWLPFIKFCMRDLLHDPSIHITQSYIHVGLLVQVQAIS
jgi:hypothetical protein